VSKSNAGRIGVWGRSGSGKSSYIKKRIAGQRRVIVFDPLEEYAAEGFIAIRGGLDAVRVAMRDNWRGFRLAYVPPSGREARALSGLSRLLMSAQQPAKDNGGGAGLTLVLEEMNLSFPVHGGEAKAPGFAEICSRGRHYGIEVIGASQRIAEVSTRFRGNGTETVVFAQKGPRDLAAAAAELGCDPAKVKALVNLSYIHEKAGAITSGKLTFNKSAKK